MINSKNILWLRGNKSLLTAGKRLVYQNNGEKIASLESQKETGLAEQDKAVMRDEKKPDKISFLNSLKNSATTMLVASYESSKSAAEKSAKAVADAAAVAVDKVKKETGFKSVGQFFNYLGATIENGVGSTDKSIGARVAEREAQQQQDALAEKNKGKNN